LEPLPFPTQNISASALAEIFNKAEKKEFTRPFSGQVAGLITGIKPAVQILEEMVEEAVDVLTRRLPESVIAKVQPSFSKWPHRAARVRAW
jgi:NAD(P)H-dependent flavin oxidoreductase YrpB (nitropropane dioxygenase family)